MRIRSATGLFVLLLASAGAQAGNTDCTVPYPPGTPPDPPDSPAGRTF